MPLDRCMAIPEAAVSLDRSTTMAEQQNKEKLINFLDRRAWKPILKASAKKYGGSDVKRLERVQKKTESQRERYHSYRSAAEVVQQFRGDLSSQAAKKTNADLQKLNLPIQPEVADEFFQLAERLGVNGNTSASKHRSKTKSTARKSSKKH